MTDTKQCMFEQYKEMLDLANYAFNKDKTASRERKNF